MKESKYIYQLISNEDGDQILAERKCFFTAPNFPIEKSTAFYVNDEQVLELVINNITQLFHQSYFSITDMPVLMFQSKELEKSFRLLTQPYNIGKLYLVNNDDNVQIKIDPEKEDFAMSFNQKSMEKPMYFISSDEKDFLDWKSSMDEETYRSRAKILSLSFKIIEEKKKAEVLQSECLLIKQSLNAVKSEYSKEIDWYKKEITNIKNWYDIEHKNTPKIITKIFKKIF